MVSIFMRDIGIKFSFYCNISAPFFHFKYLCYSCCNLYFNICYKHTIRRCWFAFHSSLSEQDFSTSAVSTFWAGWLPVVWHCPMYAGCLAASQTCSHHTPVWSPKMSPDILRVPGEGDKRGKGLSPVGNHSLNRNTTQSSNSSSRNLLKENKIPDLKWEINAPLCLSPHYWQCQDMEAT